MSQVANPNTAYQALMTLQASPILGDAREYNQEVKARRERIQAIKYVIATGEIYDSEKAQALRDRDPEIADTGGAPSRLESGAFSLLKLGETAPD